MPRHLPLDQMNTAEKLEAMESLWDDLCRHAADIGFPAWHEEVLNVREAAVREGTERFSDWDEAKESIRAELKK